MSIKGISMPAVGIAGVGALVLWSGLKGASISGGFRSLLSGQKPSGADVNPVVGGKFTATGFGQTVTTTTDSAIANDALGYQGHAYLYGGAPGLNGQSPWDCSSFCNWVIGHDMHMAIPGFRNYNGTSHGPPTGLWAVWPGAKTIPRSEIQPGDLCIWPLTHMGIAISSTQMISALNPSLGTQVTNIFPGPIIRRLNVPREAFVPHKGG